MAEQFIVSLYGTEAISIRSIENNINYAKQNRRRKRTNRQEFANEYARQVFEELKDNDDEDIDLSVTNGSVASASESIDDESLIPIEEFQRNEEYIPVTSKNAVLLFRLIQK